MSSRWWSSLTITSYYSLAYFEMRSIMARVLWNFDMQLDDASKGWMEGQKEYTLWDKPSLWVKLSRREDSGG